MFASGRTRARRWKVVVAVAGGVVAASAGVPSHAGAAVDGDLLRSGGYELVLNSGATGRSVVVRDAATGTAVLVEQQPLQLIIKSGNSPVDVNGRYTSVGLEGNQLVGTGDVRTPGGSVFRFRDSYQVAQGGGFSAGRTVTVVTASAADHGFNSRFTIGAASPRPLQDHQFLAPGVWYDRNRNVPAGALAGNMNDNYLYFREMRMPLPFVMMHEPVTVWT